MAEITYTLGATTDLEELYPPPELADRNLGFSTYADVIRHYTQKSLEMDDLQPTTVSVRTVEGSYVVDVAADGDSDLLSQFALRHVELFAAEAGLKAVRGKELMEELGVWNPMSGYPVNNSSIDGEVKWHLYPPLGLNVIGQHGMLLMHYPPWQVLVEATFGNSMTWARWNTVLEQSGTPTELLQRFQTILDVNPIAAPGSGQSEYPNDYFPIMMASAFFDGGPDRDYLRSMLELYLNPPGRDNSSGYTLPLLVCGSPLYDPQAPGWFRVAFKDQMPKDDDGILTVDVLQTGTIKLRPDSELLTPYMVANHMIAAGVTGRCTDNPAEMPDIRLYEAQDLVAATFLRALAENPEIGPDQAKVDACRRWFGNDDGSGPPQPPAEEDQLVICALAQMDLFFEPEPKPHPKYCYEEALQRCKDAHDRGDPCCGSIKPPGRD